MEVTQAFVKLIKLMQRVDGTTHESPTGGGQEFVDYEREQWKLEDEALLILKGEGFKSFRDFSDHLVVNVSKEYVTRVAHFAFRSLLPISSLPCPYLEISVQEDKFELLEAEFKELYCIQKNSLEYFDDFFGSRGFNIQYDDATNARATLYKAEDSSYVKGRPNMERFWLEVTNFIKVVR